MIIKLDGFFMTLLINGFFIWISFIFSILWMYVQYKKLNVNIIALKIFAFLFLGIHFLVQVDILHIPISRYIRIHHPTLYEYYEVRTEEKTGEKFVVLDKLKISGDYYTLIAPVKVDTENELIFDTRNLLLKSYRNEDYFLSYKKYKVVKNLEPKSPY